MLANDCLIQDEPEGGVRFSRKMILKEQRGRCGLIISMEGGEKLSLEQIRAFLKTSQDDPDARFVRRVAGAKVRQCEFGAARQCAGTRRRNSDECE